VHVWVEGRITDEQKIHAQRANHVRKRIQQRLCLTFANTSAEPSTPTFDSTLSHLGSDLLLFESKLWAASKPCVRKIMDSAAVLEQLLTEHQEPHQLPDIINDVSVHARVVQEGLHSLTNIQSLTMLTAPSVALAHTIALAHRMAAEQGAAIGIGRFRTWTEQAIANHQTPAR
jgi:hypothetical protein